ncbi:hypothetical protein JOD66_003257 [Nocardioides nitrophenolicus]|nr:hypothetical protein [Nocardioides nitrophenolicus]
MIRRLRQRLRRRRFDTRLASGQPVRTLAEACDEAGHLVALCREVHRRQIPLKTLREEPS